jgi:hopanoid biosynthesis associated RND transporter like protein HpnN
VHALRSRSRQMVQGLIHVTVSAPWFTVLVATAIAALALWYTIQALKFETSHSALLASNARYIQMDKELAADFGDTDYLIVVVEPPYLARGKQFVQALATRLRSDRQYFANVVDKLDMTGLEGKKLLYLSPQELRSLRQRLEDAQDLLSDLSEAPGLVPLLTSINQEISKALVSHITSGFLSPSSEITTTTPEATESLNISFLSALFTEMEQAIAAPEAYHFHSPWERFFLKDGEVFSKDGYLTSDNNRLLFVLVQDRPMPGSFVKHASSLRVLRGHLQALRSDFPDVQAGVTGGGALNTDEMVAAQRDTLLATMMALGGVALLFIVAFRQVWRPLLVVVVLIIAVCWTLGLTTLTVGHLNVLTVAFVPILIGLGIDFGIHLVARYGEECADNQNFESAIQTAYLRTGPGVAAAALTTALAFYAVMLTEFRGLIELGFIAGSGILLCLLASFTVMPALLALRERRGLVPAGVWQPLRRDPLRGLQRFPGTLLSAILLLTLAGFLLPMPQFDYNLLNLQAKGTESVVWEYRLLQESDSSSQYALSVADTLPELRRKAAQFKALPVVDHVTSLASIIPADQETRLPLVRQLAPYVKDVSVDWHRPAPIDLEEVNLLLQKIRFKVQRDASEWDPKKRPSEAELTAAREALLALQERLRPSSAAVKALDAFQQALMEDFAAKLDLLQHNVDPTRLTLADVPAYLQQRYVGKSGRYLMEIFAQKNIWERQPMRAFVTQLQAIDADITGTPVVAFHAIRQMQHGYIRGGAYALLVIVGVVLLLFRRPKPVLLALVPVLFGGLWTMAWMGLLDLQFNMANLIIVPLFLGIAVDGGIYLVHRMREEPHNRAGSLVHSTGKAIVLSSLTTMIGFGSLLLARHAGIFSLGLLATVSVGCSLVAALVVLPLIVHFFPPAATPPSSSKATPATTASGASSAP